MKWLCCVVLASLIYVSDANGGRSITIIQSPEIPSGDNVVTDAGKKQTLTCQASNKDQKVKWLDRDGNKVLRSSEDRRIFVKKHFVEEVNGSTPALDLVITELLPEDTGVWRCQSGKHTKDVALCVIDRATFVRTESLMTPDGKSAKLKCVVQGDPMPEVIEWRRNGNVITDSTNPSKYSVMLTNYEDRVESQLRVKSLTPVDAGVYTCVAVQKSGFSSSFTEINGGQITCESREEMDVTVYIYHK